MWKVAVEQFTTLKVQAEEAEKQAVEAKAKLIARLYKQDNIDYKSIPQLQSLDLEQYRGKTKEEVRITISKVGEACWRLFAG